MQSLMEGGLRIPEDISLVGYDDIEFAAFTKVSLTTVRIPKRGLGREAVQLLLEGLESEASSEERARKLPVELVVRASTRRIQ